MSSAFPVHQPQCRTFGVPKGLTPSTPVALLAITWLQEVSVCLGVSSTSRADQVTLSTPFYESGMLASILLVGRSPWSTRSPCRHDRLLDGRVECHPNNGMILVVPDECHPNNGMILVVPTIAIPPTALCTGSVASHWVPCGIGARPIRQNASVREGLCSGNVLAISPRGVRRRGIRSQTAWLSTIIWAITPPRVVSSGLVLWCWAMELS